jgi:hypothetical protein
MLLFGCAGHQEANTFADGGRSSTITCWTGNSELNCLQNETLCVLQPAGS